MSYEFKVKLQQPEISRGVRWRTLPSGRNIPLADINKMQVPKDDCRFYDSVDSLACQINCRTEDVLTGDECPFKGGFQEDCGCYKKWGTE